MRSFSAVKAKNLSGVIIARRSFFGQFVNPRSYCDQITITEDCLDWTKVPGMEYDKLNDVETRFDPYTNAKILQEYAELFREKVDTNDALAEVVETVAKLDNGLEGSGQCCAVHIKGLCDNPFKSAMMVATICEIALPESFITDEQFFFGISSVFGTSDMPYHTDFFRERIPYVVLCPEYVRSMAFLEMKLPQDVFNMLPKSSQEKLLEPIFSFPDDDQLYPVFYYNEEGRICMNLDRELCPDPEISDEASYEAYTQLSDAVDKVRVVASVGLKGPTEALVFSNQKVVHSRREKDPGGVQDRRVISLDMAPLKAPRESKANVVKSTSEGIEI